MITPFDGVSPQIDPTAFVHETAQIIGKVKIGPGASVWPFVVLRGDVEEIVIGTNTNIQDNTVVHTDVGSPTLVGDGVTVGHSVVLHGCRIGNNSLIGIGAIVLKDAVVEDESMVGAGALVLSRMTVPQGHLVLGAPAKVARPLKPEEIQHIRQNTASYVELGKRYQT